MSFFKGVIAETHAVFAVEKGSVESILFTQPFKDKKGYWIITTKSRNSYNVTKESGRLIYNMLNSDIIDDELSDSEQSHEDKVEDEERRAREEEENERMERVLWS